MRFAAPLLPGTLIRRYQRFRPWDEVDPEYGHLFRGRWRREWRRFRVDLLPGIQDVAGTPRARRGEGARDPWQQEEDRDVATSVDKS